MERAIPVLPVEDLDVAKEFYVHRLGFGVRFEHRGDGRDGLLGVERGPIWLTLDCPMTGHGREASNRALPGRRRQCVRTKRQEAARPLRR